ncbi:MAG: transcriptional regulator [Bacteroidetes bacterium]|jgi:DNA-binding HxlR family transcriptional regulator|nr:transcriptional regulator [Bacteroidota bacterium]
MPESSFKSIQLTSDIIGGKWKLLILHALLEETRRFTELLDIVQDITPKMLSKELKDLEYYGIIKRTQYNTVPLTVEYNLENFNGELQNLIKALTSFAKNYQDYQTAKKKQVPERIDFVI